MVAIVKKLIKPLVSELASRLGPHQGGQGQHAEPLLWVLMYHRIVPNTDERFVQEEPGMLVQPQTLQMHIREAKKLFQLTTLGAWVAAKAAGEPLPAKACAITFDDGWLDNYEYAFPILQAEQAPATVFVVAEKIGTDFQFWPNIVAALLLNNNIQELRKHPLFATILSELPIAGVAINREQMAECIRRLKRFSDQDIFAALGDINWRQLTGHLPPALMNWPQLLEMQNSGLVEIGSHTCNHKRLNDALSPADLQHEILHSRQLIEQHTQRPSPLFCFPNGDYSPQALALVQEHYQAAVTTRRGIVSAQSPLHQLTRISLHDEVSATPRDFGARLSTWL